MPFVLIIRDLTFYFSRVFLTGTLWCPRVFSLLISISVSPVSTVNKCVLGFLLREPQPMLNPQVKKTNLGSPFPSHLGLCRHIKGNNYLSSRRLGDKTCLAQVHTQFRPRSGAMGMVFSFHESVWGKAARQTLTKNERNKIKKQQT